MHYVTVPPWCHLLFCWAHEKGPLNRTDVHHVSPRNHLKKQGLARGSYNQIANFVLTYSEINIAIGDKDPMGYFKEVAEQCHGSPRKYGAITEESEMRANLEMNCVPQELLDGQDPSYEDFLDQRHFLMAQKIKTWFHVL